MVSQGFFSGSARRSDRIAGNLGPSTPVRIDSGTSIETGKPYKKVLPNFGAGRIGEIRLKKAEADTQDNNFNPSTFGKEVAKVASSDISGLQIESPSVRLANVKSYTDSTFTPSYPGDPYRDALRETDKPKKVDKKTYIQSRMAEKMYDGDIDKFKRKTLDYKTGTDFFGDKVDYSPETIKRYIATDAKEKYERDQELKEKNN